MTYRDTLFDVYGSFIPSPIFKGSSLDLSLPLITSKGKVRMGLLFDSIQTPCIHELYSANCKVGRGFSPTRNLGSIQTLCILNLYSAL